MSTKVKILSLTVLAVVLFPFGRELLAKQNLSRALDRVTMLKHKGKLTEAINKFKKLRKKYSEEAIIHYELASTYALIHQFQEATTCFVTALSLDKDHNTLITDASIGELWKITEGKEWNKVEEVLLGELDYNTNTELARRLWKLGVKDQAYFAELIIAENQLGYDSPLVKAIWDLKNILNTENQIELEEIISQYGWPKISEVGRLGAWAAFCIVQHSKKKELIKKYLPLLKEVCMQGEAMWKDYARLYDRMKLSEGGKQTYGTNSNFDYTTGKCTICPIEDVKNVNKRRQSIGLELLRGEYIIDD